VRARQFGYTGAMVPFLHLGPVTIPTYGLMVALGMLTGYYMLAADLARRGIASKDSGVAEMFVAIPCLAGIIGAKIYSVLESPRELFADPLGQIFSRYGLTWAGGLIAGVATFLWLARRKKIPLLNMLDAGSPGLALGYAFGRMGCLLSGDGDYGIPTSLPWGMSFPNGLVPTTERVHPTPIYEILGACAIAWLLWRRGARQVALSKAHSELRLAPSSPENRARLAAERRRSRLHRTLARWYSRWRWSLLVPARGSVFATYLVLTGVARFLVEFIRINPRVLFGLTNAQIASAASVLAGAALWLVRWRD
jgi:phosphatidylglycerol:prolipoprotein diacylglycerol transferase